MIKIFRAFVTFLFNTFIRVKVIGVENVPSDGAVLFASNHESFLDVFMIGYKIPRLIHWMAKEELFKNKILAKFISYFGAYPLRRGRADFSSFQMTYDLLAKGEPVGIFPQGTRSKGHGKEHKAKAGVAKFALTSNAMIQPVAIWGNIRLFGKVYVKYGVPYYLPKKDGSEDYTKEDYMNLAQGVLDNIYSLMENKDGNN